MELSRLATLYSSSMPLLFNQTFILKCVCNMLGSLQEKQFTGFFLACSPYTAYLPSSLHFLDLHKGQLPSASKNWTDMGMPSWDSKTSSTIARSADFMFWMLLRFLENWAAAGMEAWIEVLGWDFQLQDYTSSKIMLGWDCQTSFSMFGQALQ